MPTYVRSMSAGPPGPIAIDAAVDKQTEKGKAVYPEPQFLIGALISIAASTIAGTK